MPVGEERQLARRLTRSYTTTKLRVARLPWRSSRSFYDVFRLFFDGYDLYIEIFEKYENRLRRFCQQHDCGREELIDRLTSSEISSLFDFDELVHLRLDYLRGFLDLGDEPFLGPESLAVKGFLLHTKHLYHLVSILALEELNVSVIAPGYIDLSEDENLRELLREVDREFPAKLRELTNKFEQSLENLNAILADHRYDKTFVRSVFLFERERIVQYYGNLDVFYLHIYPTGLLEGLRIVAESFQQSGFESRARDVLATLTEEIERRGRAHFMGREGLESEWRRYRSLQLQLAEESDGTVLV